MSDKTAPNDADSPSEHHFYMSISDDDLMQSIQDAINELLSQDPDNIRGGLEFFMTYYPRLPYIIINAMVANTCEWSVDNGELTVKGDFNGLY